MPLAILQKAVPSPLLRKARIGSCPLIVGSGACREDSGVGSHDSEADDVHSCKLKAKAVIEMGMGSFIVVSLRVCRREGEIFDFCDRALDPSALTEPATGQG